MTESDIGSGGTNNSCSSQYCSQVTIGDNGQASSGSTAAFGEVDYGEPMIQVIVESGTSTLGTLTTEQTATKTMVVKIRNYLTNGYMLQVVGDPPSYNGHTLNSPVSAVPSDPGTEQFAINVVANTEPSVGANPVVQAGVDEPSGLVTLGYNTPNQFKYVSGETVAISQTDSGGADFTITMIVNIANSTPAGNYFGDFAAVILPYF
jgi:hypothetical protein